ncbi:hypothetical protein [Agrilactobacillus composti]|uniref:hypothetical protein n=1 Tax=Agrilactobacillus composti TaxID=398555 RepID=UPI001F16BFDD|nr:hypothetical protein [Agrilactobacillus composti]
MATDNIDPTARTLPDFNVAMVQLTQHLDTINRLSPDTAGQNRLVYSPGWIAAQGQLLQWGLDLGLNVTLDDYGTVYLDLVAVPSQRRSLPRVPIWTRWSKAGL